MDINLVNYYLFSVPVNFDISKIHIPYSRHIIVELKVDGKRGIGEGVSYRSSLSQLEKYLTEISDNNLLRNWDKNTARFVKLEPGLVAAMDQAILGVKGALETDYVPRYTKQVFIQKPIKMMREVDKLTRLGTREIKIKLGRNIKNDCELIKELKKKSARVKYKADVNCGYTAQIFEKMLKISGDLINVWEEPVQRNEQCFLPDLKEKYQIKIMLDESVRIIDDLKKYADNDVIDILNIKLSRLGGITEAKKYIKLCKQNNLGISIGCNEELGIGMKAINFIASQVPNIIGVEGEGGKRLGFDIVDKNKDFSLGLLTRAAAKNRFPVFTKDNKISLFDRYNEYVENIKAKYQNLKILLCQ